MKELLAFWAVWIIGCVTCEIYNFSGYVLDSTIMLYGCLVALAGIRFARWAVE